MVRHSFLYEGKRYDIRATDYVEFSKKVLKAVEIETSGVIGKIKTDDWFEEFITIYKSHKAPRTISSYRNRYSCHIKPFIGKKYMHEVKHSECQKIMSAMSGSAKVTILKIYHDLFQLFQTAMKNGYIGSNPVDGVDIPDGDKETRRALTGGEIKLFNSCQDSKYWLHYAVMMYCGLRPHEISLLQGKDVQDNILHIRGIKTKSSDRFVPIPEIILPKLQNYDEEEYILKSVKGHVPITEPNRRALWRLMKKDLTDMNGTDIADDWTPYCFRHTYGSTLQDAGVPINVIRELMGHTNITTTQGYVHNSCQLFEASRTLMNSHFNEFFCQ